MSRYISSLMVFASLVLLAGSSVQAATEIGRDRSGSTPLILDQNTDYLIRSLSITNVRDTAALTISGRISSVVMQNSSFGQVISTGTTDSAMALQTTGASISSFRATDCSFFDAESQLVSFKESNFGTVVFERCKFRNSELFMKSLQEKHPWRNTPPVTEFANIERLELLDNDFSNTMIVIAPSVKQVIIRGDISGIFIQDQATQVMVMPAPASVTTTTADGSSAIGQKLIALLTRREW